MVTGAATATGLLYRSIILSVYTDPSTDQLRYGELTTTDRDDAIARDDKSHARLTTDQTDTTDNGQRPR